MAASSSSRPLDIKEDAKATDEVRVDDTRLARFRLGAGDAITVRRHVSDDVKVPVRSVPEASTEGSWTIFGPGAQKLLSPSATARMLDVLSKAESVGVVRNRGV